MKKIAAGLENSIASELALAGDRSAMADAKQKKNYAETLSRALATRFANALRPHFPGILPDEHGRGQESKARTAKGVKKLDVNYSTVELGLGLGLSIKTINFRDGASNRYTKNYTRADGELRAEASDYHVRQPYAVMVAVVFVPLDSCDDAKKDPSSFGQAVRIFRFRGGRDAPTDDPNLFEAVFIGLYDTDPQRFGQVSFFDVRNAPPRSGRPKDAMGFDQLVEAIKRTYDTRNSPVFEWADAAEEVLSEPVIDPEEEDAEGES
jgi:hypothetical protein